MKYLKYPVGISLIIVFTPFFTIGLLFGLFFRAIKEGYKEGDEASFRLIKTLVDNWDKK